jgi:hypothetical protein
MWRKIDDIAASCPRPAHALTNSGELLTQCIAPATRICVMRTRMIVVQKTQSRCKEDAATKINSPTANLSIQRHCKNDIAKTTLQKRDVITASEVQGDASWLD